MEFFNPFSTIIIFLLGITLGSFLNVVIDRFATGRSIVKGRSYCESCKKTLSAKDLIPLLSFLYLKGKCRFCKKKIPIRLFLVELLTGILFIVLFSIYGIVNLPLTLLISLIILLLTAIFFIDLEYGIIPDKLTIALTISSIIYVLVAQKNILDHSIAGIGSLLFFVGLFLFTKGRGMGFGDVKLSLALGILLGFPLIIYGLYIAFLTGAIISIILVIWRKKSFKKGTVPFGPFLAASTIFSLLLGEKLILPLVEILF